MSYTLRGRLESRLAALALPALVAAAVHEWWAIELAGVMAVVALALDLLYHRALAYQPGWAAVPLGLLELGAVLVAARTLGIAAPLRSALLFYAGAWLWAQVLAHAVLPFWRWSWPEDGGELGARTTGVAALLLTLPFAGAGGVYWHDLPPTVHLSAGVHQGPLYVDRRERLVGDPGAVVRGGIVVRHRDVTISHVKVIGGEYGISVLGVRNVTLDHVSVVRASLDGIHIRHASVQVKHCNVDMRGVPEGQGIDVSYGLIQGMNVVDHCTVVGGRDGIVMHGSMGMLTHNDVTATAMTGISMVEMSMGEVAHNTVWRARGIGILCGDHSMCDIAKNHVVATQRDDAGGNKMRAGIGLEVEFESEADLWRNNVLRGNPRALGVFLGAEIHWR
jgi:parallel beta helix pectate lyase-like protein